MFLKGKVVAQVSLMFIISGILNQLTVQISYDPLECKTVTVNPPTNNAFPVGNNALPNCIVFGNTVTALCTEMMQQMCHIGMNMKIGPIDPKHMSISGSFTTTNIIMANWSRSTWQSVVNRVVRVLASGPFSSQFSSAFATVG
ncbi:hypothetical protein KIN20_025986 [Parelaphostrongylus tenuis]|uniref:Uncharacterized protein n=1 Tax=Parelaphostrongylus tenuis TaxID=148309 RepID=A0AAD5QXF5_PARTN|nr:hypothetical protein KIN20_025986 [Parelaphostrongylus tenuis]